MESGVGIRHNLEDNGWGGLFGIIEAYLNYERHYFNICSMYLCLLILNVSSP